MLYWLDTEFIEDGKTIDLISIGIVAEDGREYYAVNNECNFCNASPWVWENVLAPMGVYKPLRYVNPSDPSTSLNTKQTLLAAKSKTAIREDISWFLCGGDFKKEGQTVDGDLPLKESPEIWAYYSAYDWVAFCQLFGTMMDLPKGYPMYCRDIKQECDRLGNPELPKQGKGKHNALADARWNRDAWNFLQDLKAEC